MSKKKTSKATRAGRTRSLPTRTLTEKHARGVQGGRKALPLLSQACATGQHLKKVSIHLH